MGRTIAFAAKVTGADGVLASTANLLHTSGFKMGAPYGEGTPNFDAMREWNRATIYRKTIGCFADQLAGR